MSRDAFGGNSSRAAGSGPLECRQSSSRAKIGAEHESTRERQQATTIEFVANQQPDALRKQQRGVLAPFGLRIIPAMQPSAARGKTAECVA
jgi:hypothetical protein